MKKGCKVDAERTMIKPLSLYEFPHLLCFLGELCLQMLECSAQHKILKLYRSHSLQIPGAS